MSTTEHVALDHAPGGAIPAAHPAVLIKPDYDDRLCNEDLAPLRAQTWSAYNIFAFWMSDVHSVGGYVTAGSLFSLGLVSWQVLVSLLVGILIVQFFCNLVAKPSQVTGTPYPVICRAVFGVKGANIPAIIRGLIAVAMVRDPDLPGVGRLHGAGAEACAWTRTLFRRCTIRICRPVDARHGRVSCSSGSCRPSCSGAAWRRSASSSTGRGRRSMS